MNRKRKHGKGLPKRVYLRFGAWYFVPAEPMRDPKTGKMKGWHQLARVEDGEQAMYKALAALMQDDKKTAGTMAHLCGEFKAEKLGRYGKETKETYGRYLDVIATAFANFHVSQVTTKDWADFLRNRFKDKANTAQKYTALGGKLFRYAISTLGLRTDNPIDQIDLEDYETEQRTVLATHEQIAAIREGGSKSTPRIDTGHVFDIQSGPMFACIIDMTYLLWARAIDIRMLKEAQISETYIRIKPSKTTKSSGQMVDIAITPEIKAVIERARAIKRKYEVISPYLFPSKKGTPYAKSGLTSMWDRAKERAGLEKVDVTFKDIRALAATDAAKRGEDRKNIQQRLVHTSGKTTDIYIKEAIANVSEIEMDLPWK